MTNVYVVHWQKFEDDFWGKKYDHFDPPTTLEKAKKTAEMLTWSSYADIIEIVTLSEISREQTGTGVAKSERSKQPPSNAPTA